MNILLILSLFSLSSSSSCDEIVSGAGGVLDLSVEKASYVHLIFDESIAYDIPPSNSEWQSDAFENHLYVSPGESTGSTKVSVVLVSGASFDLNLNPSSNGGECFSIVAKEQSDRGFGGNVRRPSTAAKASPSPTISPANTVQRQGNVAGLSAPTGEVLYTSYRYSAPIQSVYDDGRFTTIRFDIHSNLEGVAIVGLDGTVLSRSPNHANNTFVVAGVWPGFKVDGPGKALEIYRD